MAVQNFPLSQMLFAVAVRVCGSTQLVYINCKTAITYQENNNTSVHFNFDCSLLFAIWFLISHRNDCLFLSLGATKVFTLTAL